MVSRGCAQNAALQWRLEIYTMESSERRSSLWSACARTLLILGALTALQLFFLASSGRLPGLQTGTIIRVSSSACDVDLTHGPYLRLPDIKYGLFNQWMMLHGALYGALY